MEGGEGYGEDDGENDGGIEGEEGDGEDDGIRKEEKMMGKIITMFMLP
jgi:hypothetical protein